MMSALGRIGPVRFVLASSSPARLATLRAAGLDPEVVVSDVDEDAVGAAAAPPTVRDLVAVLAAAKADAVVDRLVGTTDDEIVVVGGDSLLELDGRPLGKPGTDAAVAARWAELAGRTGVLHTGHRVVRIRDDAVAAVADGTASTTVRFGSPTSHEIAPYIASGEPQQVAGGFTIDGLGGWFVEAVEGDHHAVVGLSLPTLRWLLTEVGVSLVDLGWPDRRT